MKTAWYITLILFCTSMTGCVIVDVGVMNPNPEISSVVVAPFFNQSAEKAADGRRIALVYATELQKVPGYQVVPVGVAENAIAQYQLQMSRPTDVLKLAKILNVDAVVIGTVTDYDPYYPPRIGLHIEWYSPYPVQFQPGIPIDPDARKEIGDSIRHENPDPEFHRRRRWLVSKSPLVLRGQSPGIFSQPTTQTAAGSVTNVTGCCAPGIFDGPITQVEQPTNMQKNLKMMRVKYDTQPLADAEDSAGLSPQWRPTGGDAAKAEPAEVVSDALDQSIPQRLVPEMNLIVQKIRQQIRAIDFRPGKVQEPKAAAPENILSPSLLQRLVNPSENQKAQPISTLSPVQPATNQPVMQSPLPEATFDETRLYERGPLLQKQSNPLQPFMSYSRMFDGSDAKFTAALRNHLELTGDIRSGGWKGSLQRSEDFIRFSSLLMIKEMLTLHGGESSRRIVIKHRKYK